MVVFHVSMVLGNKVTKTVSADTTVENDIVLKELPSPP